MPKNNLSNEISIRTRLKTIFSIEAVLLYYGRPLSVKSIEIGAFFLKSFLHP